MRIGRTWLVGVVLAAGMAVVTAENDDAPARPCTAMVEAWYGGDVAKMDEALHPDLAKRGVITDPGTGITTLRAIGKAQMMDGARRAVGRIPADEWKIRTTVLDRQERLATVRVDSAYLVDVCQVALIDGRWVVVNVLWTNHGKPPWW